MEEIVVKKCVSCELYKYSDEFYENRSKCKKCRRIEEKENKLKPKTIKPTPKEGYKFCSKCGEEKLLEDFPSQKYCNICKKCSKINRRQYYENNKFSINERTSKYSKEHKELVKAYKIKWENDNPEKVKESKKRYQENNKDILKIKQKIYRKNNPEKGREGSKRYYKSEKGKENQSKKNFKYRNSLLNKINDLTYSQEIFILKHQNYCCAYCGNSILDIELQKDHIIPVNPALVGIYQIDGGYHSASNIQILCKTCNVKKSNKLDHKGGVKMLVDLLAVLIEKHRTTT